MPRQTHYWIINLKLSFGKFSQEISAGVTGMIPSVILDKTPQPDAKMLNRVAPWMVAHLLCISRHDVVVLAQGSCAQRTCECCMAWSKTAVTPWPAQQAQHGIRICGGTRLRPQARSVFAQRLTAVCRTACLVVSSHLDSNTSGTCVEPFYFIIFVYILYKSNVLLYCNYVDSFAKLYI